MKKFNVTGVCVPELHYMVDTKEKMDQIIQLIEENEYFTMNRARQYGKTTTFAMLNRRLGKKYHIIWMSFEGISEESFVNNIAFVESFISMVSDNLLFTEINQESIDNWADMSNWNERSQKLPFDYLSKKITQLCRQSEKEILLMIDEVDKISDNQVFLNFLGMLRNKYLFQRSGRDTTFKSVILAGIYDIKNLKMKLRPEEEKKYNSPWNIAADFTVDMSFSPKEIATMLVDYEKEQHTGMDIGKISEDLYFYTNGYPFLVSRICKWIDEQGGKIWTSEKIRLAEKELLHTPCTLFDDLIKNYENNRELQQAIDQILINGKEYTYVMTDPVIQTGVMFGIFKRKNESVAISNIMFETLVYNHVLIRKDREGIPESTERSQFIMNGHLDVPKVLKKFQQLMRTEYRQEDGKFVEQQGRLLFLCFLKPIINGTGFYYVEPETRSNTRMDIVVAYGTEEHIIELKIWHGAKYREDGIRQLEDYMDYRGQNVGYLVSFSFKKEKENTCSWIDRAETRKNIFEVVI